ncbi:MAG: aquaporin [Anaerolineae bacterium]|nr:aquaporin [Anaerolineae bacterium]
MQWISRSQTLYPVGVNSKIRFFRQSLGNRGYSKYLAEVIGTFVLVFAGCGAIVVNDLYGGALGHVGISLVFGLVVMALIYAVGNISGAHFNPAVTLGFFFARRLPGRELLPYLVSELGGAAALLKLMFPTHSTLGATLPGDSLVTAFVLEVVLSFILMFVILNVSTGAMEKGIMAGAAIGATVMVCALFAGPVSGASMNPARSLGPALASGQLAHSWLYVVAPIIGAAPALPTCRLIQGKGCCYVSED